MQSIAVALLNKYLSARDEQERYSDSREGNPLGTQDCPRLASTHMLVVLTVKLRNSLLLFSGVVGSAQLLTEKINAIAQTKTLRILIFGTFFS